ncbi:hypothetical protein GPALN_002237 [Globodera pallida]|nr:hypothetical protein GPALN_002237 [Globodera pallida]
MDFSAKNHIFADPPSPPGPVPVDDEERPLPIRQLAQIKALKAKNDELRYEVLQLRHVIVEMTKKTVLGGSIATAAPTCGICLVEEVTCVLKPCGHTFCEHCANLFMQQKLGQCPYCRQNNFEVQRIYFS